MSRDRGRPPRRAAPPPPPPRWQLVVSSAFLEDLAHWVGTHPRTALRILRLVTEIVRDPFAGAGKPEPLRGLDGCWSRRITEADRLVYRVRDGFVDLLQARFHYDD